VAVAAISFVVILALVVFASCGGSSGSTTTRSQVEWAWISGSNVNGQAGTYGQIGQAASSNVPGARTGSGSWTDTSGNLWLFGGYGNDSKGNQGWLNDLWKYSGGEWTWMSGADVGNQAGTYGQIGQAASSNVPGARDTPVSWTDTSGNLWLFGGNGYDSQGNQGLINDLWKYRGGEGTWMSGADVGDQAGTYGQIGQAASSNAPGARSESVSWTDTSGNLWLFGGNGYDSKGNHGLLNDLWK